MVLDAAGWIGLIAGILFGLVNLLASHWTTRKALLLGEKHAIMVMIIGFMVRLGLLAIVVLGVPETWMNSTVFVLTFLAAFMAGVLLEARNVLVSKTGGTGSGNPRPPDSLQGGIEVEASR